MHPPETPREHFEYLHELTLHAEPPSPKWAIGEKAARLWMAYHEQADLHTATLIELIQVLMPYRFAGSGFLSLWQTVLNSLRTLAVQEQIPVWRAVFNPAYHDDRPLSNVARSERVLHHWSTIAQECPTQDAARGRLHAVVKTFGPELPTAYEWLALAYAIQKWFERYQPLPSFLDLVIEQHNASVRR